MDKVYLNDVPLDLFIDYYSQFKKDGTGNMKAYTNFSSNKYVKYGTYESPVYLEQASDGDGPKKDAISYFSGVTDFSSFTEGNSTMPRKIYSLPVFSRAALASIFIRLRNSDYNTAEQSWYPSSDGVSIGMAYSLYSYYSAAIFSVEYDPDRQYSKEPYLSDENEVSLRYEGELENIPITLEKKYFGDEEDISELIKDFSYCRYYGQPVYIQTKVEDDKHYLRILILGTEIKAPKVKYGKQVYLDSAGQETFKSSYNDNFLTHQTAMRRSFDALEKTGAWQYTPDIGNKIVILQDGDDDGRFAYSVPYSKTSVYSKLPANYRDEDDQVIYSSDLKDGLGLSLVPSEVNDDGDTANIEISEDIYKTAYLNRFSDFPKYTAYTFAKTLGNGSKCYIKELAGYHAGEVCLIKAYRRSLYYDGMPVGTVDNDLSVFVKMGIGSGNGQLSTHRGMVSNLFTSSPYLTIMFFAENDVAQYIGKTFTLGSASFDIEEDDYGSILKLSDGGKEYNAESLEESAILKDILPNGYGDACLFKIPLEAKDEYLGEYFCTAGNLEMEKGTDIIFKDGTKDEYIIKDLSSFAGKKTEITIRSNITDFKGRYKNEFNSLRPNKLDESEETKTLSPFESVLGNLSNGIKAINSKLGSIATSAMPFLFTPEIMEEKVKAFAQGIDKLSLETSTLRVIRDKSNGGFKLHIPDSELEISNTISDGESSSQYSVRVIGDVALLYAESEAYSVIEKDKKVFMDTFFRLKPFTAYSGMSREQLVKLPEDSTTYYKNPLDPLSIVKEEITYKYLFEERKVVDFIIPANSLLKDNFISLYKRSKRYFADASLLTRGNKISGGLAYGKQEKAYKDALMEIMGYQDPNGTLDTSSQWLAQNRYERIYNLANGFISLASSVIDKKLYATGTLPYTINLIQPEDMNYRIILEQKKYSEETSETEKKENIITIADMRSIEQKLADAQDYPMDFIYEQKLIADAMNAAANTSGTADYLTNVKYYSKEDSDRAMAELKAKKTSEEDRIRTKIAKAFANSYFNDTLAFLSKDNLRITPSMIESISPTFGSSEIPYRKVYSSKMSETTLFGDGKGRILKDLLVPTNGEIFKIMDTRKEGCYGNI